MMDARKPVLIFGDNVLGESGVGTLVHDSIQIEQHRYPSTDFLVSKRLSDYRLVILSYAPFFVNGTTHVHHQDRFLKEMMEALKTGTHFCFLHYHEDVPAFREYSYSTGDMNPDDVRKYDQRQLGFHFLYRHHIKPEHSTHPLVSAKNKREEFVPYLRLCGATRTYFRPFINDNGAGEFTDVIQGFDSDLETAFVLQQYESLLFFLPYQMPLDINRRRDALRLLVDNLLTYLAKNEVLMPDWANQPFFKEEIGIRERLQVLESESQALKKQLEPFDDFKKALFLSEHHLEIEIRRLFNEGLGIACTANERYNEDFMLRDSDGKILAVGEIKSTAKGFKKGFVYATHTHRETNGYDESFPAILIASCYLQAQSLGEKLKPIPQKEYELASHDNILILRVEDLLRLWEGLKDGKWTSSEIATLLCTSAGWLEVNEALETKLHK